MELQYTLGKALVYSSIPCSFLDNPYFIEYQNKLMRMNRFVLPTSNHMKMSILPHLHDRYQAMEHSKLSTAEDCTLAIDSYTDYAGNIVYIIMLLKIGSSAVFVDSFDLTKAKATVEHVSDGVGHALERLNVNITRQIAAVVTDSSSMMRTLSDRFKSQFKHIVTLPCCVNVWHLLIDQLVRSNEYLILIRKNLTLMKYLFEMGICQQIYQTYRDNPVALMKDVNDSGNPWLSLLRLGQWIKHHEEAILTTLNPSQSNRKGSNKRNIDTENHPDNLEIPENIHDIVTDKSYFHLNDIFVQIIRSVYEGYISIDKPDSHLGDILMEYMKSYKKIYTINTTTDLDENRLSALGTMDKIFMKYFHDEIYVISLFLYPGCKQIVLSKFYDLETITFYIIKSAFDLDIYSSDEARRLKDDIQEYYDHSGPYQKISLGVLSYWRDVQSTYPRSVLAHYALRILHIRPKTVGLSSSDTWKYISNKRCNNSIDVKVQTNLRIMLHNGNIDGTKTESIEQDAHELIDDDDVTTYQWTMATLNDDCNVSELFLSSISEFEKLDTHEEGNNDNELVNLYDRFDLNMPEESHSIDQPYDPPALKSIDPNAQKWSIEEILQSKPKGFKVAISNPGNTSTESNEPAHKSSSSTSKREAIAMEIEESKSKPTNGNKRKRAN